MVLCKKHSEFCERLRTRRLELGFTELEVAERLGISVASFVSLESGEDSPTLEMMFRVADELQFALVLNLRPIKARRKNSNSPELYKVDIAPIHAEFCRRLKARRKELGLTQADVAEKLGVSQPSYATIESGVSKPRLNTVVRLAKALEMTIREILP